MTEAGFSYCVYFVLLYILLRIHRFLLLH